MSVDCQLTHGNGGEFQGERVNLRWSPIISLMSNCKSTEALFKNIFCCICYPFRIITLL